MSFFFFKQKSAYEMRISDWSSDVCSSDLKQGFDSPWAYHDKIKNLEISVSQASNNDACAGAGCTGFESLTGARPATRQPAVSSDEHHDDDSADDDQDRSEERRVGKACGRSCRARWARDH